MHSPTDIHWTAVKHLLRYLKHTLWYTLYFSFDNTISLHCFSDSDWEGCPDTRRSTSGYGIYLGNSLISWSAKKQNTVARSSSESEYKALANTTAEVLWIQSIFSELRLSTSTPPTLWCDNLGAIYMSHNPIFHARTKHIELDFHFVCEHVANGKIQIGFLSTKDQIGDIFTKPLGVRPFQHFCSKLRLVPHSPSACRGVLTQ